MPYMVTVAELQAQGYEDDETVLVARIGQAEQLIEAWCGWWFEARPKTLRLDGSGTRWLEVPVPAVAIDSLRLDGSDLPMAGVVSYCDADNRFDPHLYREYGWPQGHRNVEVTGTWGFVEDDGSVPEPIKQACSLLVAWLGLPVAERRRTSQEAAEGAQVVYERDPRFAGYSGNPDIDSLIVMYRRPVSIGVV